MILAINCPQIKAYYAYYKIKIVAFSRFISRFSGKVSKENKTNKPSELINIKLKVYHVKH